MRKHITNLAQKLIGTPYVWGGQTPAGFDCSGFVCWIFEVFDLKDSQDYTAAGLFDLFPKKVYVDDLLPGDLVFYGKDSISHVMMFLGRMDGQPMVIGASGGDSTTRTVKDAKAKNAQVKVKPLRYRSDYRGAVSIGLPA